MKRTQTTAIVLFLCLFLAAPIISSVSAVNLNIPEGANIIYYSGGECYVTIPMSVLNPGTPRFANQTALPAGTVLPSTVTLEVTMTSTRDGSNGPGTSMGISVQWTTTTGLTYIPNAYFANVPADAIAFIKTLLKGFPAAVTPPVGEANTRYSDAVIVERHGNSITAQLTKAQAFIYAWQYTSPLNGKSYQVGIPVTLPPFTVELNKVGGDVQRDSTYTFTPNPPMSGYTQEVHKVGFDAKGTITFDGQQPKTIFDGFITMHGTTMWTPPLS